MTIKEKISTFPKTPGIYLMKDKENNIIYVGKSKKLQDRIRSYFVQSKNHSKKIKRIVQMISDIEIITTDTELDALMLECEYIKNIKPMYNTLLKNYEAYSYLKINIEEEYQYLEVVNEIEDDNLYFGPYTKSRKLDIIKNILNENYKLRHCKKMNKCFRYELNQCIGPCRGNISKDDYNKIVLKLIDDLWKDNSYLLEELKSKMQEEINSLNFEKASQINENIKIIESIFNKQSIINQSLDNKTYLVWINIDDNKLKLYIIKNGDILKSEIMNIDKFNNLDKDEYVYNNIKILSSKKNIDKYDIDFINIIYGYINNDKNISGKIIM